MRSFRKRKFNIGFKPTDLDFLCLCYRSTSLFRAGFTQRKCCVTHLVFHCILLHIGHNIQTVLTNIHFYFFFPQYFFITFHFSPFKCLFIVFLVVFILMRWHRSPSPPPLWRSGCLVGCRPSEFCHGWHRAVAVYWCGEPILNFILLLFVLTLIYVSPFSPPLFSSLLTRMTPKLILTYFPTSQS